MYYINSFLLYSVIGFVLESSLFKIVSMERHSGILYGPITIVYGIGAILIILIDRYILSKIRVNKILKILISFLVIAFILTLIEFTGGHLINIFFNIDMWDYSSYFLHFGKYVCLRYFIIWGLLGIIFLNCVKPFMDKIIKKIPNFMTRVCLLIFIMDIIFTLLTK